MYPWYAIWFLPFTVLNPHKKNLIYLSLAFAFGLLLRYLPFMYSGSHLGYTPILRIILMSLPLVITGCFIFLRSLAQDHPGRVQDP